MSAGAKGLPTLCRDCLLFGEVRGGRCGGGEGHARLGSTAACPVCGGLRLVRHPELGRLAIAHIDCDAFFASVEKRDRPELVDRPVIVGGGRRGVVAAACYVARLSGVRSAMPMFRAEALCPDAVVIRPDFAKYAAAARAIRDAMRELTPMVQPLSIDEAVLDLGGAAERYGAPAAVLLARFAQRVESEMGLTVSIGLAPNRLLAKLAAGRDKPRGFAVIGAAEARAVLAPLPVRVLPGIGPVQERRLAARGITRLADLQGLDPAAARTLGRDGVALVRRACGEDDRAVSVDRDMRSISTERTFERDLADPEILDRSLLTLTERLAERLRERHLVAGGVVLKLRTGDFATRSRHLTLVVPTARPDRLFAAARTLLQREADGRTAFRLIGVGAEPLREAGAADQGDLADPEGAVTLSQRPQFLTLRTRVRPPVSR
ncbi:MAG: DNA polymerase IV [Rhodospirillales bacterium]|nr:DNA polymerase IV [Rhodospirillales bacterium]